MSLWADRVPGLKAGQASQDDFVLADIAKFVVVRVILVDI